MVNLESPGSLEQGADTSPPPFYYRFPPFAATLCAVAAKLPLDTEPPFALAVAAWIRDAAADVMGVREAE